VSAAPPPPDEPPFDPDYDDAPPDYDGDELIQDDGMSTADRAEALVRKHLGADRMS
jgi:hypothetical protein